MISLRAVLAPALFAAALLGACSQEVSLVTNATRTAELQVEGMTCTGCEGTISSTVLALDGIEACQASFDQHRVVVTYKPALTNETKIAEAIQSVGYEVKQKP